MKDNIGEKTLRGYEEYKEFCKTMNPVKCIVPVSGGKDSQACLKMALEEFESSEVVGLFCDVNFESPKTYKHVKYIGEKYGVKIIPISEGAVLSKCKQRRRFPGGGARHCTNELKIIPTKKFLKAYAEEHGEVQVWYGMRTGESSDRAKRYEYKDPDDLHLPHEVIGNYPKYLGKLGVRYRLPIVDWYTSEVMDYLEGEHNELYDQGFTRVGCFPCLAGGDKAKIKAFEHDEFGKQQLIDVRVIESEINKSVFTAKIGQAWDDDNQGCRICEI